MKNILIAMTIIAATLSTSAYAAKPTSGNAEFKGKVAKVCEVGHFKAGKLIIRENTDGNVLSSVQGKPATFVVRGNAKNINIHFGKPQVTIVRKDGASGFPLNGRKITIDATVKARKNNSTTTITGKKVKIASVGTNDVSLDLTITDKRKNSTLPAGTYTVIVPVSCTK